MTTIQDHPSSVALADPAARSKRSGPLKLVLMAAVPIALAGCEGEPTGQVLASADQCNTQTEVPVAQCVAAYETAKGEHARVAPRFNNSRDCDEQFGNCAMVNENGQTSFIPPMTGFLIGYALGGMGNRGGYGVGGASPLYRDYRSGGYLKPNGDLAGKSIGNVSGSRGEIAMPARAMTVSRAGFGSSASARGGFGSGRGGFGG